MLLKGMLGELIESFSSFVFWGAGFIVLCLSRIPTGTAIRAAAHSHNALLRDYDSRKDHQRRV